MYRFTSTSAATSPAPPMRVPPSAFHGMWCARSSIAAAMWAVRALSMRCLATDHPRRPRRPRTGSGRPRRRACWCRDTGRRHRACTRYARGHARDVARRERRPVPRTTRLPRGAQPVSVFKRPRTIVPGTWNRVTRMLLILRADRSERRVGRASGSVNRRAAPRSRYRDSTETPQLMSPGIVGFVSP